MPPVLIDYTAKVGIFFLVAKYFHKNFTSVGKFSQMKNRYMERKMMMERKMIVVSPYSIIEGG